MNDITVVITGMVLLMSPYAYDQSKTTTIHSAVAVNATEPKSAYGVDIPQHFSSLYLGARSTFAKFSDTENRIVDEGPDTTRVDLDGDLVQLGTFDGSVCTPYRDDTSDKYHPTVTNSIKELPRMADLVKDITLLPKTYPVDHDYRDLDTTKVAAWLEIPLGRLLAVHSKNQKDDEAMFLPMHRSAMLAKEVRWQVADKYDHCILVTPFKTGGKVYVAYKPGSVSIDYENVSDEESGEGMTGVGFDYEVLYGLFTSPPAMPPLPFSVGLIHQGLNSIGASLGHGHRKKKPADGAKTNEEVVPFNLNTGVNCGPATIPSGG